MILNSLARNIPLEDQVSEGDYQIVVSHDIPSHFQICPRASGGNEIHPVTSITLIP